MGDLTPESDTENRDSGGRFAKGNRFWEARSSHGRKPKFQSADALWSACLEYFEWVEANPLCEEKPFAFQGKITMAKIAKMRAMTITGLCNFLDIDETTWHAWRNGETDLSKVTTRAEKYIRQQKFEGASAEMLNANIIARDLGLRDSSVTDHTSSDGSMSPDTSKMTIAEIKAELAALKGNE